MARISFSPCCVSAGNARTFKSWMTSLAPQQAPSNWPMLRALLSAVFWRAIRGPFQLGGLYHMTCGGSVSWCGFARAIFAALTSCSTRKFYSQPIVSAEYPTPAKRRTTLYCRTKKLHTRFGVQLSPWEAALDTVLLRLADTAD